jgi:putative protease
MVLGDTIEVFGPRKDFFQQKLTVLLNEEGEPIESAPHPQQILQIKMEQPVDVNYILRKEK